MNITRRLGVTALAVVSLAGFSACGQQESVGANSSPAPSSTVTVTVTPDATASSPAAASSTVPATAVATTPAVTSTDNPKATASRSTTAPAPQTSTGTAIGAHITQRTQIDSRLAATSDSFRAYITTRFDQVAKDGADCASGLEIGVEKYWSDDLALGDVQSCGGARALWYRDSSGAWKEYAFQGVDLCSHMATLGLPASAARAGLQCSLPGGKPVPYTGAAA